MDTDRVIVIGAGVGGMVAALLLAHHGLDVVVVERAARPGGKLRQISVDGAGVDSGPTVLTLRGIFEEIFADAGARLADHLTLRPLSTLARHAWDGGQRLDLFADIERSVDAIAAFAGLAEAARYRDFCRRARRSFDALDGAFLRAPKPSLPGLLHNVGLARLGALWRAAPMSTLWQALGEHFHDPRLRQLFGRYATYSGASPYLSPATLMVIAHVEQQGVWLVEGGMQRIAASIEHLAIQRGVSFRYGFEVRDILAGSGRVCGVLLDNGEKLEADAVVLNADVAAMAAGLFGQTVAPAVRRRSRARRSLSAVTWSMRVETGGFPLLHHSVFFSRDYRTEFDDIFRRSRLPAEPTVYVCAQDRTDGHESPRGRERLLCLINAPAMADSRGLAATEIDACEERTFHRLHRMGLDIWRHSGSSVRTTPADFDQLFPATGGALYGPAQHGWMASFQRPGARTRIPGLYLAGGSTHPGPGLPMVALSGRQAAMSLLSDLASTAHSRLMAMPGGMSTR